ncbi:MAG: membrane protein insertion efficiency factor YidD [Bacteroidota bacterium]
MQKHARKFLMILLLFSVSAFQKLNAHHPQKDVDILKSKVVDEKKHIHKPSVTFMRSRSDQWVIKYNPVRLLLGSLMFVYQGYISPQLPSECLYHISCSNFSQQLIIEYGLFKGIFSTSDRLMRCNRISALDVHPLQLNSENGKVMESTEIYKMKR